MHPRVKSFNPIPVFDEGFQCIAANSEYPGF
jgi:hypothetical protein